MLLVQHHYGYLTLCLQNLQSELEKTKLKYQELERQKGDSQGKLDDLDKEVRHVCTTFTLLLSGIHLNYDIYKQFSLSGFVIRYLSTSLHYARVARQILFQALSLTLKLPRSDF